MQWRCTVQLSRNWLKGYKLCSFKIKNHNEISGASIVVGRSRVLNSEDFREKVKLSSRRSESMNFREVENRGISATEKRQRRRRLLKILNSRLRESSLSQCNATTIRSFSLIKYSIEVYKTPSRRMNLILMSFGTNICRREKHSITTYAAES